MAETETKHEGLSCMSHSACEVETGPATCDQTGTVEKTSSPPNFREDRDWYHDLFAFPVTSTSTLMDEIEMVFT